MYWSQESKVSCATTGRLLTAFYAFYSRRHCERSEAISGTGGVQSKNSQLLAESCLLTAKSSICNSSRLKFDFPL